VAARSTPETVATAVAVPPSASILKNKRRSIEVPPLLLDLSFALAVSDRLWSPVDTRDRIMRQSETGEANRAIKPRSCHAAGFGIP
jgi:hypothetical protein